MTYFKKWESLKKRARAKQHNDNRGSRSGAILANNTLRCPR